MAILIACNVSGNCTARVLHLTQHKQMDLEMKQTYKNNMTAVKMCL